MCCSRACSVSAKPWLAVEVDGAADDAARHLAHVFHACVVRKPEVRTARGQRHAERLAVAAGDVGALRAPLARRLENARARSDSPSAMTSAPLACAQSVMRVDVLEHAEEVRLLDHDGGDVLALVLLRGPRRDRRPFGHGNLFEAHALPAGRGAPPPCGSSDARVVGTRMRCDFDLRCARTAISDASATAEPPSYSDALETSMPVSAAIIVWYS